MSTDSEHLFHVFDLAQLAVTDRRLTPMQRRCALQLLLRHLAEIMGSATAAYDVWLKLMEGIQQQAAVTRH